MSEQYDMSEQDDMSETGPQDPSSSDELASLLAKRGKRGRAKSTSVLIAVLLVLLGVLVGIGIGRATASGEDAPRPVASQQVDQTPMSSF